MIHNYNLDCTSLASFASRFSPAVRCESRELRYKSGPKQKGPTAVKYSSLAHVIPGRPLLGWSPPYARLLYPVSSLVRVLPANTYEMNGALNEPAYGGAFGNI